QPIGPIPAGHELEAPPGDAAALVVQPGVVLAQDAPLEAHFLRELVQGPAQRLVEARDAALDLEDRGQGRHHPTPHVPETLLRCWRGVAARILRETARFDASKTALARVVCRPPGRGKYLQEPPGRPARPGPGRGGAGH